MQQPKRLALLAYLAAPVPGTRHRRDVLLAAFWLACVVQADNRLRDRPPDARTAIPLTAEPDTP